MTSVYQVLSLLVLAGILAGYLWVFYRVVSQILNMVGNIVERVSGAVKDSVTQAVNETIENTVKALVGGLVGEAGEEGGVQQAQVGKEGDVLHPAWMEWDGDSDEVDKVGVGDSVYFGEREANGRAAILEEGESIIPGVPLPDMSGENFRG